MNQTEQAQQRKSQLKLLALIALFIGPLVITWIYHEVAPNWRPDTNAHGRLITPLRLLPELPLLDANDEPVETQSLRGQWLLLQYNPGECREACQKLLLDLRQLRLTFGKDQNRLQNIYVGETAESGGTNFSEQHSRLFHLYGLGSTWLELEQALSLDGELGLFYLVDPRGNLMLVYHDDYVLKKVRKDIKRLLSASVVG